MHFVSADTQQAKYTIREICRVSYRRAEVNGVEMCLLKVRNELNQDFFFNIYKFLPEFCIPEFEIDHQKHTVSNFQVWDRVAFWICDGAHL